MKRFLQTVVVMLVLFSLVLAGCGTANENNQPENDQGQQGDNNEETVKLTMGSWRTEDKAAYQKILSEFNKQYPDIEIEFTPTKNTEYNTVLNTALQTGGGPDIIHLRPYAPGIQLGESGFLEPINDIEGIDVFSDQVLSAARAEDGTIYGVPMAVNSAQIFYNKKLFNQYNLEEPATWEELMSLSATLKENGVTPFAFGSKDGWILSLTHSVLGPTFYGGTEFIDQVLEGETDFTSEAFVSSIEAMNQLKPYLPENYIGLGDEDNKTLFTTEQAAMYIIGDWAMGQFNTMNPDLEFDLFPVPSHNGGEPTVTTWVDGSFAVNANSAHKEAAKKFLEFATTEQFGTLLSDELRKVSTVPGVEASDPLVTKITQYANEFPTPYMILVYFNEGNPTTKSVLQDSLQGMYLGELTAEEVAAKVQDSADTWFNPNE